MLLLLSPMKQLSVIDDSKNVDDRSKIKLVTVMLDLWSYMELKGQPITVTSTVGGKHKINSKHYEGQAIDHIPDKGYSQIYVNCLKTYLKESGLDKTTRTLIEFNHSKVGHAGSYRCTHLEWSEDPAARVGIYALDYETNKSYPVDEVVS